MTREQIATIESVALTVTGGITVIYPPAAPIVSAIKMLLEEFDRVGLLPGTPIELSAEQAASIAAGMAAARSSAVTTFQAHNKGKSNV